MTKTFVFLLTSIFFGLVSCTQAPLKVISPSDFLFPTGSYQQDVTVKILAKGHEKNFDFNCIVQKNTDSLYLVGYNSFGMSLFKIKEANGEIKMESNISQINEKKEFFLKVFDLVKTLLNVRRDDPRLKDDSYQVDFQNIKSHVHFAKFDPAGVPLKIEIESADVMQIAIETTQYTLK